MIEKFLAGAALVFALLAAAGFKLYFNEVRDYEQYRAQTEAAQRVAQDAADERDREARENTAEVARIYSDRLDDVERSYISRLDRSERLRAQAASNRATAQAVAASTRLPDGEPSDIRPDPEAHAGSVCPEIEGEFRRLERDCAKTTVMLYGLQDYVFEVCK